MKTKPLNKKLTPVFRTPLVFFGILATGFLSVEVALAQQPGMGTRLLIPSAAYTDAFTSTIVIMNLELGRNTFTISAYDTSGNPVGTPLRSSLLYRQQFQSSNILKDLGAPFGSFGPIRVESSNNQLLSVASEVRSNQGYAGFFPAVDVERAWNIGVILDVVDDGSRGTPNTHFAPIWS